MMGKTRRLRIHLAPRQSPKQSQRLIGLGGGLFLLISGCQSLGIPGWSPTPLPSRLEPTRPSPSPLDLFERDLAQQVNQYRQKQKLPPLQLSAYLNQQARLQSERMARENRLLGPDEFEDRKTAIANVLTFQTLTVNLAMIQGKGEIPTLVLQHWLKNPQQRQNLAGNYELTGIGIGQNIHKTYFVTQIFLKKPSLAVQPPPSPPRQAQGNPVQVSKLPDGEPLMLALEISAFQQVNQYRLARGLTPLRLDPRISQVARKHAQVMARHQAPFSHKGFEQRAKTLKSVIPLQTVGENLAYIKGYSDEVSTAVKGWINSPGHRKNMEGKYNLTGMGVAKNAAGEYYFSQLFVLEP